MKKLLVVAFVAFSTVAVAQEREIEFKLNGGDISIIAKALGKMPYDEVAPLIQKLQIQIATHTDKLAKESEKKEEPKN